MTTAIRPIETRWQGWRFRSRCEARWAVFLEALGVRWDYEPEGYVVDETLRYLPDFLVTVNAHDDRKRRSFYVEVKDDSFFDGRSEWERWASFATAIKRELLVVFGTPALEARCILVSPPVTIEPCPFDERELHSEPVHQDRFARIATVAFPRATVLSLSRAIEAARGARFEHGECPSPRS